MRSKFFRETLPVIFLILTVWSGLFAAEKSVDGQQGKQSEDQKYIGTWVGSYIVDNGYTEKLSYTLSKDEKGQWKGITKFTNQDGEQTAELKGLAITDGKFKAKVESPDGQVEVTIEGTFQGDRLEGSYSGSPKGSTDVVEKGTWKVTKSAAPKN